MTKYSTDQINRYVKDMTPHTRQLVGTAMTVLKCDEEMLEILRDEDIAFSIRAYLFGLIAEGFDCEDIEKMAEGSDIFGVVKEADSIRKTRGEVVVKGDSSMKDSIKSQVDVQSEIHDAVGKIFEKIEDMSKEIDNHMIENLNASTSELRKSISAENQHLIHEILGRQKICARSWFPGIKKVKMEHVAADEGTIKDKIEDTERAGTEYAIWCLQNIHELSKHQCDILYDSVANKGFRYSEVRTILFDVDGKLRTEEEMEEENGKVLHRREKARKLEGVLTD